MVGQSAIHSADEKVRVAVSLLLKSYPGEPVIALVFPIATSAIGEKVNLASCLTGNGY
jgi:hypothetical protein